MLDVNLIYRRLRSAAVHPVYGVTLDGTRWGAGFTVFYDLFKKKRWRAFATAEYFREDTNVDFFDARIRSVSFGAIWRYKRQ